ncbi:formiminoglutamase [Rufibacter sp. DG15C]|uniref:formimidoylglutamase n=1 Tax=Rufibacter sp. DG15C TaxID=1379909 RepID=UPI00078E4A3A|nr:formimidoylglutamase [Rufibacter sp. DG15C]AMM51827.1 formiminoglutamase [Rufibacter sp. DG15C]
MYKPTDAQTWKGRVDAADGELGLRWHQVMQLLRLSPDQELPQVAPGKRGFAFLGFCCDEGVRRNQGRVGAASAPPLIRQAMASFANHLPSKSSLHDAGDVLVLNQHLEEAQVQLGKKVQALQEHGYKTIVLGGGHETAYGHFLGLQSGLQEEETLGVINFDAHFDLRSYATQPSSGTPFLQIADVLDKQNKDFNYLCLGIQEYGNTRALFNTAQNLGAEYVLSQDLHMFKAEALKTDVQAFLSKVDKVYVSIDLDVFAAGYAPGVSAPAAMGVQPDIVLLLLQEIMKSGKVLSLDVVELNPQFDIDSRTAKLAASLIYHSVMNWR